MAHAVQPKTQNKSKNKTKKLKRPTKQTILIRQKKRTKINTVRKKKDGIITGAVEITKMRTCHVNKSENLDEMDNSLRTCNLSKLFEAGKSYIDLKEIESVAKNLFTKKYTKPKLFHR